MKQSTKNKIGAGIIGVGMFLGTIAPLAAQDNAPYVPRPGRVENALIIDVYPSVLNGFKATEALYDIDGDARTTDDQGIYISTDSYFKRFPKHKVKDGDNISFRPTQETIDQGFITANNIITINGKQITR
jgi:hypothetical protein